MEPIRRVCARGTKGVADFTSGIENVTEGEYAKRSLAVSEMTARRALARSCFAEMVPCQIEGSIDFTWKTNLGGEGAFAPP
jgi:hypothetical protein